MQTTPSSYSFPPSASPAFEDRHLLLHYPTFLLTAYRAHILRYSACTVCALFTTYRCRVLPRFGVRLFLAARPLPADSAFVIYICAFCHLHLVFCIARSAFLAAHFTRCRAFTAPALPTPLYRAPAFLHATTTTALTDRAFPTCATRFAWRTCACISLCCCIFFCAPHHAFLLLPLKPSPLPTCCCATAAAPHSSTYAHTSLPACCCVIVILPHYIVRYTARIVTLRHLHCRAYSIGGRTARTHRCLMPHWDHHLIWTKENLKFTRTHTYMPSPLHTTIVACPFALHC